MMIWAQVVSPPVPQITNWFQLIGYLAMLALLAWNTWESRKARMVGNENSTALSDVKVKTLVAAGKASEAVGAATVAASVAQTSSAEIKAAIEQVRTIANGRLDTALNKITSLETKIGELEKVIAGKT